PSFPTRRSSDLRSPTLPCSPIPAWTWTCRGAGGLTCRCGAADRHTPRHQSHRGLREALDPWTSLEGEVLIRGFSFCISLRTYQAPIRAPHLDTDPRADRPRCQEVGAQTAPRAPGRHPGDPRAPRPAQGPPPRPPPEAHTVLAGVNRIRTTVAQT